MTRRVVVVLTEAEAGELSNVAGNGYGDGDYYLDGDGSDSGRGGRRGQATFLRAIAKLDAARFGVKRKAKAS